MQKNNQEHESGSVIFFILIAIALFAALNYAFTQSSRTDTSKLSEEKSKLLAAEIIDYARVVKNTVQAMKINNCTDAQISFDQSFVAGYSNTNAPSNNTCHVFESAGGGLYGNTLGIPDEAQVAANPNYVFNGTDSLNNVGSTASELLLKANLSSESVCEAINEQIGLSPMPTDSDEIALTPFTGSYGTNSAYDLGGKLSGCIEVTGGANTGYFYISTMIAR